MSIAVIFWCSSVGGFSPGPFDPGSFQGSRQLGSFTAFQERTSPLGTTTSLLSSASFGFATSSLGPTPFETNLTNTLQTAQAFSRQASTVLLADPGRALGIVGSLLPPGSLEQQLVRVVDYTLYTGGPFQKAFAVAGGLIGTELGRAGFAAINPGLVRVGGVVGNLTGSYFGAQVGGTID